MPAGKLVPALVRGYSKSSLAADVVGDVAIVNRVAAAADLEIDFGVVARVFLGVFIPLAAPAEDEAVHVAIAEGHARGDLLIHRKSPFHHLWKQVENFIFFDGGVDVVVPGLQQLGLFFAKGPLRHLGRRDLLGAFPLAKSGLATADNQQADTKSQARKKLPQLHHSKSLLSRLASRQLPARTCPSYC